MTKELEQAARGQTSALAQAARVAAERARENEERRRKRAEAEAAARAKPDAIAALLAQADAALNPEAVAASREQYSKWLASAEDRARQEEALLDRLRALHRQYPMIKDRDWCEADPTGREKSALVSSIHVALDAIYGAKPTDPDYSILRSMRSGSSYGDYADAIYLCVQDLPRGGAPVLVRISDQEDRNLQWNRKYMAEYIFRLGGKAYVPNGYEGRPEVRRVVDGLMALRTRGHRSLEEERKRAPVLLQQYPVGQDIARIVSRDSNDNLANTVSVAVSIRGLEFPRPGQMSVRQWFGVVHLEVGPGEIGGKPVKILRILDVVGDIARIFTAGNRWAFPLVEGARPFSQRAHNVRTKKGDALLSYIEQRASRPEHLGLDAWKAADRFYGRERRPAKAQFPAKPEAPATVAEAAGAEVAVEEPKRTRRPRRPRKEKSAGTGADAAPTGENGATGPADPAVTTPPVN